MRKVNQAGLDLIKKSENDNDPKAGYVLRNGTELYYPYIDPVGVCTIGFGTIMYPDGKKVSMSDSPISKEKAYEFLQWELHEKAEAIQTWSEKNKIILNDNQFSALCSLAYNCGAGVITDHGRTMNSALLMKDNKKIREAFSVYVKGTVKKFGIQVKVALPGLVTRRKKEVALFFS